MTDKKSKKQVKTRRGNVVTPDPEATIIKTNQAKSQGLSPRLGSASASVIRTQPKTYSPQYLDSSLNFPRDVKSQNSWNRNFFVTNPIVSSAIRLHAAYTTGKFKLVCKDRKIKEFFDDMLEKMSFQNTLLEIGLEYWKLGECCLPGTLITMGDGSLKPIEDLARGDEVLTHKGNIKKVTDLKTHHVQKKIQKIKSRNSNRVLEVTGNHPIWALKHSETMCDMSSLSERQTCWPNSCQCDKSNSFKQSRAKEWNYDFIAAEELTEKDYTYLPFNNEEVAGPEYITDDWCRLFGYWLSEGCFAKNKYGNKSHIVISNSEEEINKELRGLASRLGYNLYETPVQKSTVLNLNFTGGASKATDLVEQFYTHGGEYSEAKTLSQTIMQLSPRLQKIILATFINGDGSVDKSNGQIQISTNSLNLRNQLGILLARNNCIAVFTEYLGKYAGVNREYTPTNINYRLTFPAHQAKIFKNDILTRKAENLRENKKGQSYSTFLENGVVRKIQKVEQEWYEGWVYNLEVEDDHSYVAEGVAVHNCFPYAELDEEQGVWDYVIVHNPDFIHVPPPSPLQKDPIITLVPDESLKRLVTSTDPRDRALRNMIPPEVLLHIQKGEDIPLDNFNVSHLKMLSSPYDTRGTSLITSCYRDLLLYDKIREAKIIQADNFINPLTLVKLGSENFKPTDDDIRQWQEQVLDSMGDAGYSIVTHSLVEIQKISNSGQTLDMNPDLENAIKNIMVGLNVPQALFDQDYGSYASASVGLEVLKDRYKSLQLQLKKWIEKKILEPIAKIQDFYVTEGGEEKLIVPTVEFDKINLKETDSFIGQIAGQIGDPATPGSGKISMHTFYELLDTNYEAERVNLKMEARDQIVLQKEIAGMMKMDIAQLKTLNENTPIQDPGEIDSLEKSLDIEQDAAAMGGGAGGMGGAPAEDMGDIGGDMGGEMGMEEPGAAPGGEPGMEGGGEPAPAGGEAPPV